MALCRSRKFSLPGHVLQAQPRLLDHREIDLFRLAQRQPLVAQRGVQPDHEVEEVQVVLQEHLVLQRVDVGRLQRIGGHRRRRIAPDEGQDLRAQVEVPQDQPVGLRRHEALQPPGQQPVQQDRMRPVARHEHLRDLDQDDRQPRDRPQERQQVLPRARARIGQPGGLDVVGQRRALVEVQRQPGAGVALVVGLLQEFRRSIHGACVA